MITLGLIGLGKWGKNYLKAAELIEGCQIKYIVAKSESTLAQFPDKYTKLTDYLSLAKYSDINGVIIATPGSTHFQIVSDLSRSDLFLLVEKPLTVNLAESKKLNNIKNLSQKLMVGHIYLYNPAYLAAKKLTSQIGQIRYISFTAYNQGPFRDDMSSLLDWGPHSICICLDLFQTMPKSVSAWAVNSLRPKSILYDNTFVKLEFEDNITCLLESGWLYPFRRRELIIYGTTSSIYFNDLDDKKISLYKNLGPDVKTSDIISQIPEIVYPPYPKTSPLENELQQFVTFIKSKQPPKTNLQQALSVAKVIDAAEKSIKLQGQTVKL